MKVFFKLFNIIFAIKQVKTLFSLENMEEISIFHEEIISRIDNFIRHLIYFNHKITRIFLLLISFDELLLIWEF